MSVYMVFMVGEGLFFPTAGWHMGKTTLNWASIVCKIVLYAHY